MTNFLMTKKSSAHVSNGAQGCFFFLFTERLCRGLLWFRRKMPGTVWEGTWSRKQSCDPTIFQTCCTMHITTEEEKTWYGAGNALHLVPKCKSHFVSEPNKMQEPSICSWLLTSILFTLQSQPLKPCGFCSNFWLCKADMLLRYHLIWHT